MKQRIRIQITLVGNEECDVFRRYFEQHPYKQPGDFAKVKLLEMMEIESKKEKLGLR